MTNTNNLRGLFTTEDNASGGGVQLDKTARLTTEATEVARDMLKVFEADLDTWEENVLDSQESHDSMDALIRMVYNLDEHDIQYLKDEDEETLDKMIRSQQSKRSRTKAKEMTMDNYITLLTGAVAENLLRIAAGKPKGRSTGGARAGELGFTDEELETLANDAEALTRAIRNIQSKKSIEKKKDGFSEESERWSQLLEAEAALKAVRDGHSVQAQKAAEAADKIEELLKDVDAKDLKAADAKEMLDSIKEMLASK